MAIEGVSRDAERVRHGTSKALQAAQQTIIAGLREGRALERTSGQLACFAHGYVRLSGVGACRGFSFDLFPCSSAMTSPLAHHMDQVIVTERGMSLRSRDLSRQSPAPTSISVAYRRAPHATKLSRGEVSTPVAAAVGAPPPPPLVPARARSQDPWWLPLLLSALLVLLLWWWWSWSTAMPAVATYPRVPLNASSAAELAALRAALVALEASLNKAEQRLDHGLAQATDSTRALERSLDASKAQASSQRAADAAVVEQLRARIDRIEQRPEPVAPPPPPPPASVQPAQVKEWIANALAADVPPLVARAVDAAKPPPPPPAGPAKSDVEAMIARAVETVRAELGAAQARLASEQRELARQQEHDRATIKEHKHEHTQPAAVRAASVSDADIEAVVRRMLEVERADEFARKDLVASVVTQATSATWGDFSWLMRAFLRVSGVQMLTPPGPEVAIGIGSHYQCWPFAAPAGTLVVRLHERAFVGAVAVGHRKKAIDHEWKHAPRDFDVLTYPNGLHGTPVVVLEGATYDADSPFATQVWNVVPPGPSTQYVAFRFRSNHGATDFSCLYRVRVFEAPKLV